MNPEQLAALAAELVPDLPQDFAQRAWDYVHLLEKWNRVYNLTAVRSTEDMVFRHVLDSLTAVPFITGSPILDVGSGAGLPGLILALACPHQQFVLLDSNRKKTQFITQASVELSLRNVQVVYARCEQYQPAQRFAHIISRAFASLVEFYRLTAHLRAPEGTLLAMKGALSEEEWRAAEPFAVQRHPLHLPGQPSTTRCMVIMR